MRVSFSGHTSGNIGQCTVVNTGVVTRTATYKALCPAATAAASPGLTQAAEAAVTVTLLKREP